MPWGGTRVMDRELPPRGRQPAGAWFIHGGRAADNVALAHAFGAHAEIATNDIGLDPSYGGAVLELGDLVAQPAWRRRPGRQALPPDLRGHHKQSVD